MNAYDAVNTALIHSIWQDALIGIGLWALLLVLSRRTAAVRYVVACTALALMALVPIATAAELLLRASADVHQNIAPAGGPTMGTAMVSASGAARRALLPPAQAITASDWIAQLQPWALPLWIVGVLLFSVRLLSAGLHVRMLERRSEPADEGIAAAVASMAGRLGVARPVRILVSTLADGPATIGWLRPIILIPPAAMLGITPGQLESLLAHELAHIRRHDFVVNVVQMTIETLFFYQPAVWWASKRIRVERELCCDDIAVASCGDAYGYAHALTRVARWRVTRSELAVGAGRGPLVQRIQRVLAAVPGTSRSSPAPAIWTIVIAATLVGLLLSSERVRGAMVPGQAGIPTVEELRKDNGTLAGRVLDAQTGLPISGAIVALNGVFGTKPKFPGRRDLTKTDGRYEISLIDPGQYLVTVRAPGYSLGSFGHTSVDDTPSGMAGVLDPFVSPLTVRGGQVTSNADIRLDRLSGVSGRIFGDSGDGLVGVEVELLRTIYQPEGPTPVVVAFVQTKEFGVFRANVPPGEYLVRAYLSEPVRPTRGGADVAYAPSFFPTGVRIDEAQPVVVHAGQDVRNVDIGLTTVRTHTVNGRVKTTDNSEASHATVELVWNGTGSEPMRSPVTVDAAGRFQVRNVIPGMYSLLAQDHAGRVSRTGVTPLTVDRDVEAEIALEDAVHVEGRFMGEDGERLPFDAATTAFGFEYPVTTGIEATAAHVAPDGAFVFNTPAGFATVHLDIEQRFVNLPGRGVTHWHVKAIRLDGADVTDSTLPLAPGTSHRLDVVLTDRLGIVSGSVSTPLGGRPPYALVVLLPDDPHNWSRSRLLRTGYTNQQGAFELREVPPGVYRVAAVTSLPSDTWRDPSVLGRLWSAGTRVQIVEGQSEQVSVTLASAGATLASSQQANAPTPQFDVASVKPNTLFEQPSNNWRATPGKTDFHNSQLIELIRLAWSDFQLRVENGPDWITRGRFDVIAQYPVDTPRETQSQMMRALLVDRFKLAAHLETREVPTYSLVVARADRRLGPRLNPPLAECPLANGTLPPAGSPPQCGPGTGNGAMKFGNIRIGNIALYLSRVVGRRVIDNTALTESYKIDLKYTPPQPLTPPSAAGTAPPPPPLDPDAPDVFVALQEQLGLKLEDAKGQIQVLVIDHIEQPSAN